MEKIFLTYYDSPIGQLEIKGTAENISSILFMGEQGAPDFDKADKELPEVILLNISQLDKYFQGELQDFDFPFAQTGTEFQQKVWAELTKIPFGKTISYLELARRIGNVKSIRAVGTTNGKNQLSIVVPCHRVIGSDGSLTGYGGGLWRKKWLLDHERQFAGTQLNLFDNQ